MRATALVLSVCLLAACGGGGGGGGSAATTATPLLPGTPPAAAGTLTATLASPASGVATVTYTLGGMSGVDAVVEWSGDGGRSWSGAAPADGCPTTKGRGAGTATYRWDTVADGAAGAVLVRVSAGGLSASVAATVANPAPSWLERSATVDAGTAAGPIPPVHDGHYDLSPVVQNMAADPALPGLCTRMGLRSWRLSVGRWEIGPTWLMAPEPAAWSDDPAVLRTCSREFYRGPNTLAGAQDPANYAFAYLDQAIRTVEGFGAEPYLCFDYMPFTLAATQDPANPANLARTDPTLSFSNGIRTSPPADDAVYAEVVKRTVMHVNGTFAGGLRRSIRHIEIGNEPDLPQPYFWSGDQARFTAMYRACADALDAEFGASISITAGSFALPAGPFMAGFLANRAGARLDALGFHVYQDDVAAFVGQVQAARSARDAHAPGAALHCTEWSRALNATAPFQTMTAALHHAQVLEWFTLLGVARAHHALVQDPVESYGCVTTRPARLKPSGGAFAAFALLAETPTLATIRAIDPPDQAMLVVGRSAQAVTAVFFHARPPAGQVGRMRLRLAGHGLPGTYAVDRWLLTDATCANGDGLWHTGSTSASGDYDATIPFTADTLVVLRLAAQPWRPAAVN